MKFLILFFTAIQLFASFVFASGRVVRGGGGFAEMQASYALNLMAQEIQICELPKSCLNLSETEKFALTKIKKSLLGKTLKLDYKPDCAVSNPVFSFETFHLNIESCHLYDSEQKPLSYKEIFKIVFVSICSEGTDQIYSEKINCATIHEKLFLDIDATNEQSTLYQSLDPVYVNVTTILSQKTRAIYFSIEYAKSSYRLDDLFLTETNCEILSDFKILGRSTFVSHPNHFLYSDMSIEWTCQQGASVGTFTGLLTMDNPILEKDLSDKSITFFLSKIELSKSSILLTQ